MQPTYIDLDRKHIVATVRPEFLLLIAIEAALKDDKDFINENPGFEAVLRTLAITEENHGDSVKKALASVKIDDQTKKRIHDAQEYIAKTAMFLTPAGRAWGIILDAGLANAGHDVVTGIQKEIFGGGKLKPIITTAGLRAIFNAMANTHVTIDGTKKSLAQLAIEQVGAFGSPDNNVIGALLPMAIQGKLTDVLIVQVISGLRSESVNPAMAVPTEVVDTATQVMSSFYATQAKTRTLRA